jgi:cyclophilin family peptidyl-prolyl cis-trans isomerase
MSVRKLVILVTCCLTMAATSEDAAAQSSTNPVVAIETSLGTITAELDRANAPLSVENFLQYIESGHYNGTIFHRVIKGFMVQGGGRTADLTEKPTRPPIKNEARNGLTNDRGTLLNNSGITPDAYGYAVFGRVTAGLDVVDQIEGVATGTRGPHQNVPDTAVEIRSITVQ